MHSMYAGVLCQRTMLLLYWYYYAFSIQPSLTLVQRPTWKTPSSLLRPECFFLAGFFGEDMMLEACGCEIEFNHSHSIRTGNRGISLTVNSNPWSQRKKPIVCFTVSETSEKEKPSVADEDGRPTGNRRSRSHPTYIPLNLPGFVYSTEAEPPTAFPSPGTVISSSAPKQIHCYTTPHFYEISFFKDFFYPCWVFFLFVTESQLKWRFLTSFSTSVAVSYVY